MTFGKQSSTRKEDMAVQLPNRRERLPALLVAVLATSLCLALPLRAEEFRQVSHYSVRLFSLGTFSMGVRTGDIQITGWDDPHVQIEAEKVVVAGSQRKAADQYQRVQILLDGQDEKVHLHTIYPPRRLWRPFRGESKLSVNFRIHMPYDANLELKCVDGDVWVRGVTGNVTLLVNYGSVEVDIPSVDRLRSVRAKTWLGNVQSDLHQENSVGFRQKVLFWNPYGAQDIKLNVHMGGIYIFNSGQRE
jgi:hypothetical protein